MSLEHASISGEGGLLYLYGIVHGDRQPDAACPAVVQGRLAALVERVPAEEFAPAVLERQLGSVEWVAELARRHEARLESAMQAGPVIPARLCTLFSGDEALRRLLAEDEEDLLAALGRLNGAQEWGLKLYCDMATLRAALAGRFAATAAPPGALPMSPGQAFVLAKRREAQVAEMMARRLEEVQDLLLDVIEPIALETCVKRLLPAGASQRPERMIANLGVLVAQGELAGLALALDDLVEVLAGEGFVIEQSGPWPPYSFTQPGFTGQEESEEV